jgi:hypothetical protein
VSAIESKSIKVSTETRKELQELQRLIVRAGTANIAEPAKSRLAACGGQVTFDSVISAGCAVLRQVLTETGVNEKG